MQRVSPTPYIINANVAQSTSTSTSRPISPTPSYGHRHTMSGRMSISGSSIRNLNTALEGVSSEPEPLSVILSKNELRKSIEDYEHLLVTAKFYRNQMIQLASAAANFGYALERVAKSRAALDAGQGLQATAGLQLLISNHQQLLVANRCGFLLIRFSAFVRVTKMSFRKILNHDILRLYHYLRRAIPSTRPSRSR
ncbi:hypothetical protein BC936DRAFT_147358 [Jimgerdemannia flammicorona]|uniref:Uncharacterized protein n=1 Tax=Jimgerdemannia flammicorona TaxID=994334 RepID=A0A433D5K9_9FUNG|nr:hypothetical protein BC936DRAFT_147358 [Jimgerdemannia flammicorona]